MSLSSEQNLIQKIRNAKQAINVLIDASISTSLITEFQALVHKGLAINFIISRNQILEIETDPFKLYKILGLRSEGASIYDGIHSGFKNGFLIQVDFAEIYKFNNLLEEEVNLHNSLPEFHEWGEFFDSFLKREREYRLEDNDLVVDFSSKSATIFEHDKLALFWDVKNASKVKIQGIGEVNSSGTINIKLDGDQLIKLEASNDKQRKVRVISVKVVNDFAISYDLQFLNPSSKEFTSIPDENQEGVFGVISGQKARLIWDVRQADSLTIEPIGKVALNGHYDFMPKGRMEFVLKASLHFNLKQKRLIIQEFPVPVFSEKFIKIWPEHDLQSTINVDDKRLTMLKYLSESGYLNFSEQTAEITKSIHEMNSALKMKYSDIVRSKASGNLEIHALKRKISARIKNYFDDEPAISEVIQSLKKYYD
jgi:uncharacterized protein YeeX (DUF496 family)